MKYAHLSDCVGKQLTAIVETYTDDSVLLAFGDVWTVIELDSEDEDASLSSPWDRNKLSLVSRGFDKTELIDAKVLTPEDCDSVKLVRQKELHARIAEAEMQLKNLQRQAQLEGLTP